MGEIKDNFLKTLDDSACGIGNEYLKALQPILLCNCDSLLMYICICIYDLSVAIADRESILVVSGLPQF